MSENSDRYFYVIRIQVFDDGPFYTEGVFDTYTKAQEFYEKNEFLDFTIEKVKYYN